MKDLLIQLLKHPIQTVTSRKEIRYIISGGASAVVEYISFLILISVTNLLIVSNSLSFIMGMVSGFIFHKTWSFRGEHQFKTRHQFAGYVGLAAINFFIVNIIISYLVHGLNINPPLAKLISLAIAVSWTFFITNYGIFKHKRPTETQ